MKYPFLRMSQLIGIKDIGFEEETSESYNSMSSFTINQDL